MPHCSNCEAMVSPTFARVFGDNDGRIHGCVHCRSSRELTGLADEGTYPAVESSDPLARP